MHHTGVCSRLVRQPRFRRASAVVTRYGEVSAW